MPVLRLVNRVSMVFCGLALLFSFAISSHWPLAGDSVLMHYVVFLTGHGHAPYRDIAEMNLPLSYMSEQAAMRIFGSGNVGWRLYDGVLVLALVLLCWRILHGRGAAAGVVAGTLFAAVHLQDGIHMAGQRDLLVAVLQAGAGLALLHSFDRTHDQVACAIPRQRRSSRIFLFCALCGALGMSAACIKPPAFLFLLVAVVWRAVAATIVRERWVALLGATAGALLPLLACAVYLQHFHAIPAFLQALHGLIPYHARIERKSLSFLISHIWSPVLPFVLGCVATLALVRGASRVPWSLAERLAAIGVAAGLLSYLIQGKGFPYQRYPFLLWLLLLCASRVWSALEIPSRGVRRLVPAVPLAAAGVLLVLFLVRSTRFSPVDPYAGLRSDLRATMATDPGGSVQCLDTAGPCIGALLKEHIAQTTGFLYDCYLLGATEPVVKQQREKFVREWERNPPELLVLTDSNCFTGPRSFVRYTSWPWMQRELSRYQTVLERHPTEPLRLWSRPERPYAYRILRRQ